MTLESRLLLQANLGLREEEEERLLSGMVVATSGHGKIVYDMPAPTTIIGSVSAYAWLSHACMRCTCGSASCSYFY